ncbi:hypothetical protein, partial [Acetobacter senegalensis]
FQIKQIAHAVVTDLHTAPIPRSGFVLPCGQIQAFRLRLMSDVEGVMAVARKPTLSGEQR